MGMEEKNRQSQNSPDEVDRLLDATLAKYATAEPRPGLEERILANLRAEQTKSPRHAWWHWSLVATSAIVLIAVVAVALRWSRPSNPPIVNRIPVVTQSQPQKRELAQQSTLKPATRKARPRSVMRSSQEPNAVADVPKLDRFSSPQPLSAEEAALAQYVTNFPKEARFVAEAQEEFELETRKIMNDAGLETQTSNPIQPER